MKICALVFLTGVTCHVFISYGLFRTTGCN